MYFLSIATVKLHLDKKLFIALFMKVYTINGLHWWRSTMFDIYLSNIDMFFVLWFRIFMLTTCVTAKNSDCSFFIKAREFFLIHHVLACRQNFVKPSNHKLLDSYPEDQYVSFCSLKNCCVVSIFNTIICDVPRWYA
jgi:hypothetical protein